jgi:hypothetical protein
MIAIEIQLLAEITEALRAFIEQEYQFRKQYAIQQRRFDRDIEPVERVEAMLRNSGRG